MKNIKKFIIAIVFITLATTVQAEEIIQPCDSYCVAMDQVLTEYVYEYKDGTAPIFNEDQSDEFWVEFWDIIVYLVDLKENGII